MAEWLAECWKRGRGDAKFLPKPDAILYNGPEAVALELEVEAWLKRYGIPGEAFGEIIWDGGDKKIHHIVRLLPNRGIELTNTSSARWAIYLPDSGGFGDGGDYGEEGDGGDGDDGDGEGEGEMVRRLFGRFFDGKHWRKVGVCDPEHSIVQRLRVSLGLIDEDEAEIMGDTHRRARQEQVHIVFERFQDQPNSRLRINLPAGLELKKEKYGGYTVVIPDSEIRRKGY